MIASVGHLDSRQKKPLVKPKSRTSYAEDIRWPGTLKQMRNHLEARGLFVFRHWYRGPSQHEIKFVLPTRAYKRKQPARHAHISHSYQPISIERVAYDTRRRIQAQRAAAEQAAFRNRLRRRIQRLDKDRRQLFAILKNAKLEPRSRAHFLSEKAQAGKELSLCRLQ
jgi:hypothetical protein